MKILTVTPVFLPLWNFGGTVTTSFELCQALVRQEQEVAVLTTGARRFSQESVPTSVDTNFRGLPVRYCRMWGPAPPFWSPELGREVRRRAPGVDLALIRSCWTYVGLAAGRACRRAGVPYLAYCEGSLDPWALSQHRFRKRLWWHLFEGAFFREAAAIVALNGAEREHLRRLGLTGRIEVIPNGVNFQDLKEAVSREDLESRWPPLRGRRWLLFLGRLHPKKGLDLLLPAFAAIADSFPEHLLVIAGPDEGGFGGTVHRWIRELDLASRIVVTGPVAGEVRNGLLQQAEVFVLTSYSEGQPLAVLEALACGLPVLLTPASQVPEVGEGEAGLVVPATREAIAQGLSELLADEGKRRAMGARARELARGKFTWERAARQTLDLGRELVGET